MIVDLYIENIFLSLRTQSGVDFFSVITMLGKSWVVLAISVVFCLFLFYKKDNLKAAIFILIMLFSQASSFALKEIVDRLRPLNGVYTETSASFPSGHALSAIVLYGLIFYFVNNYISEKWLKIFVGVAFSLLILLVGLSRLYLGVHYLTDVIAGYFIGLIWIFAGIYFFEKRKNG